MANNLVQAVRNICYAFGAVCFYFIVLNIYIRIVAHDKYATERNNNEHNKQNEIAYKYAVKLIIFIKSHRCHLSYSKPLTGTQSDSYRCTF